MQPMEMGLEGGSSCFGRVTERKYLIGETSNIAVTPFGEVYGRR